MILIARKKGDYITGNVELKRLKILGVSLPIFKVELKQPIELPVEPTFDKLELLKVIDELLDAALRTDDNNRKIRALQLAKWLIELYKIKKIE